MRLYPKLPDPRDLSDYKKHSHLGVTDEVGDFLFGLVRMMKPHACLETGTEHGNSARAIGEALKKNGHGALLTCETDEALAEDAARSLCDLPVTVLNESGEDLIKSFTPSSSRFPSYVLDFVFIDGGSPDQRLEQLKLLGNHNVAPLGLVCYHDACDPDYQLNYEEMISRDWPHLIIPEHAGVAVFQRPEEVESGANGCPSCHGTAIGMAGGMRNCNTCGHRW